MLSSIESGWSSVLGVGIFSPVLHIEEFPVFEEKAGTDITVTTHPNDEIKRPNYEINLQFRGIVKIVLRPLLYTICLT